MTALHHIHEAGILFNLRERSTLEDQRPYTFMVRFHVTGKSDLSGSPSHSARHWLTFLVLYIVAGWHDAELKANGGGGGGSVVLHEVGPLQANEFGGKLLVEIIHTSFRAFTAHPFRTHTYRLMSAPGQGYAFRTSVGGNTYTRDHRAWCPFRFSTQANLDQDKIWSPLKNRRRGPGERKRMRGSPSP